MVMDKTTETTNVTSDTTAIAVETVEKLKDLMLELKALGVKFTATVQLSFSIDGDGYTSYQTIEQ
jgi:hypothetical protein